MRCGVSFRSAKAENQVVLVKNAGCGECDSGLRVIGVEILAKVEPSALAKAGDRLACGRIQRIEEVHDVGKDTRLLAVRPIAQPTAWLTADIAGIKFPELLAFGSIQREDLERGTVSKDHPAHNQRVHLQSSVTAHIHAPYLFQSGDIGRGDLRERGVVIAVDAAVIGRPIQCGGGIGRLAGRGSLRRTRLVER